MKVRHQIAAGAAFLLLLLGWVVWQLVLPWVQRTLSDPSLEDRPAASASASGSASEDGGSARQVSRQDGHTEAPDLLGVGGFRSGPSTDDGRPQTVVDFEFDQAAWLNGGDRSSFHLVPRDGGDVVDGRGVAPPDDQPGDRVVSVLFVGRHEAGDYARGVVDTGIVNSRESGANADAPFNIAQAADLGDGRTANPDLASVTIDGDLVRFAFDQPLTDDDVVQDTGGLRLYFPTTSQASTLRHVGAQGVERLAPDVLGAFFGSDLPEGAKLSDAVGAIVRQGTVQAAPGAGGGNDGAAAFDEVAPLEDSGDRACPPAPERGSAGGGDGPTAAPDLVSVGNFRRGPMTPQMSRTTCVDFVFDEPAFLTGGDRTNLHLAPADGGDALDATSNVRVPHDDPGDRVVTAAFPGELAPEDVARGFVDTGIVNSRASGANADAPLNVAQAADVGAGGTANPDLVSATIDGDLVRFVFDQPLTDDDVVQDTGGLRVYFPRTREASTLRHAGAQGVRRVAPDALEAFFGSDLPEGAGLSDAVGAILRQGTVQAAPGDGGGNDGAAAFDEVAPLEDSGARVCPPASESGSTGARRGPTAAPDLMAVGNFRRGPTTPQMTRTTCVDFVFDQPAFLAGGDRTNLHLAPSDGGDALDATSAVRVPGDQRGDRVITVAFPGELRPGGFARGFVDSGVVSSRAQGPDADAPLNIAQSADIGRDGATANPDLELVRLDGRTAVFAFDQALTSDDVVQDTAGLRVYFPANGRRATIAQAGAQRVERLGPSRLRAHFTDLPDGRSLEEAVGAFVVQGAVQAAEGSRGANDGANAFDEVRIDEG